MWAGILSYSQPILASLLGWLILGESLTVTVAVAVAVAVAGSRDVGGARALAGIVWLIHSEASDAATT